jgi:hypothetical protein
MQSFKSRDRYGFWEYFRLCKNIEYCIKLIILKVTIDVVAFGLQLAVSNWANSK